MNNPYSNSYSNSLHNPCTTPFEEFRLWLICSPRNLYFLGNLCLPHNPHTPTKPPWNPDPIKGNPTFASFDLFEVPCWFGGGYVPLECLGSYLAMSASTPRAVIDSVTSNSRQTGTRSGIQLIFFNTRRTWKPLPQNPKP